MAILHTGIVAGVAPGASIAGFVVDHSGASAAYAVALAGGVLGALAAQTARPSRATASVPVMTSPVETHATGVRWRNWSGLEEATPSRVETPASVAAVVDAVRRAREDGTGVKMTGTGHSFTAIAAPEHTLLRPEGLTGVLDVDREAMTVTARAGTRLKDLNLALERLGLSLHNMGDIAEQTLAGATSTGTHGTGGTAAGLAAQLAGLELVTGTGEVLRASAQENPDVLDVARVGLGALGILTSLTFHVEPLFVVEAHEQPMTWDRALGSYDEMVAAAHHVDMYWFPHTDAMVVKQNVRTDLEPGEQEPPSRLAAWWEDELRVQHGLRRPVPRRVARARAWSRGSTGSPGGRCRSGATATSRTGSS